MTMHFVCYKRRRTIFHAERKVVRSVYGFGARILFAKHRPVSWSVNRQKKQHVTVVRPTKNNVANYLGGLLLAIRFHHDGCNKLDELQPLLFEGRLTSEADPHGPATNRAGGPGGGLITGKIKENGPDQPMTDQDRCNVIRPSTSSSQDYKTSGEPGLEVEFYQKGSSVTFKITNCKIQVKQKINSKVLQFNFLVLHLLLELGLSKTY